MSTSDRALCYLRATVTLILVYLFPVTMEEVQQGSNGTESQTAIIPTTITTSQFSQIAQQVTNRYICHQKISESIS